MSTRRILIVDDDSNVVRILARTFERSGYAVTTARNGAQAHHALSSQEPFEAMICDIQMPQLTGRELCQKLANEGPYLPAVVVVVTSRSEADERDWVREIPAITLIEKPVGPKQLLRTVRERLEQTDACDQATDSERRAA